MRPRLLIVGTVVATGTASAAVLGYLLFVGRRALVQTGDANLRHWVGPTATRWLYLSIIAFLVAAFCAAAVLATRPPAGHPRLPADRAWWSGGSPGALAGLALGLVTVLTGAIATGPDVLTAPVLACFAAVLAGAPLAGGRIARITRHGGDGALAGLWFGVLLALVAGLALVVRDTAFADRLVSGAWLHDHVGDPLCNNRTGDTLAACEQGDSLGTMASYWLLFPLAGAALGALGGLVGRGLPPGRPVGLGLSLDGPVGLGLSLDAKSAPAGTAAAPAGTVGMGGLAGMAAGAGGSRLAVLAPVGLGAVLFTAFVLEATFKIW